MGISRVEEDRREGIVAQLVSEGCPTVQAVIEAGYSSTTAYQRGETIVRRAMRNSPMIAALDKVGVTTHRLAKQVKRGLKSKKVTRLVNSGMVEEFTDDDMVTQHRYLETALRLRGEDPDTKTDATTETFEQRVMRLRLIATSKPKSLP